MWLPGAGVGGEDLTAKNAKGAKKGALTTKDTKFTKKENQPQGSQRFCSSSFTPYVFFLLFVVNILEFFLVK
jgi:hypothetical protein